MSKNIGGTTTQFLYDRLNPIQELNGTGGIVASLLTGLRIDEDFSRTASGTMFTLLSDALGSTIGLVTENNGPIATSYTYQPFGATTVGGTANGNSYEFTGRENDVRACTFTVPDTTARHSRDSSRRIRWISEPVTRTFTLT